MISVWGKRGLARWFGIVGPWIPTQAMRQWFCRRWVRWVMDDAVLPRQVVSRPVWGVSVPLLCNTREAYHRMIYWCRRFPQPTVSGYLCQALQAGDTLVDIGANHGHYTVLGACRVGSGGRVHAFEANQKLADCLKRHVQKHGLDQVSVHAFGLAEVEAKADLNIRPDTLGASTFRVVENETTTHFSQAMSSQLRRGDDVFETVDWHGRVFVKIDVEGFEVKVLQGMLETLRQHVDCVLVEVSPQWLGTKGVAELFSIMDSVGFEAFSLDDTGCPGGLLGAEGVVEQQDVLFVKGMPVS